ncbi:hypothetical protein KUTeg_010833 [Tegillarca granosa]|uniref:Adenomatous polyposis coli protein n=1 Tax=Tegillarca granosa TaxID=220873 RepID=A0ABQ9F263_TEGGR|nr:hypothetical protein KUTeg_010833 [Tegillarca granosa]
MRQSGIRTPRYGPSSGPAVAALMKLSFDEEHRHAICSLGGVQAIAELIEVDSEINGNTSEQYNVTMRRYGCMALTNLTFGDGTNKALLCSMKGFMEALVYQLQPSCEDLCQGSGSWNYFNEGSNGCQKEATLKSILSALWNLSAHGSENKADICAVDGALEFLVSTLTYKSPSKTMAVVENGGGILRNISSHITVREDYRQILRRHGCLQILLKQLRSTSLTIVSNACGTLWNLSARCLEDQKALWDMGAVGMLRNLVNSKHQMISMGSSAALKNLLAACPSIKDMKMDQKSHLNRPTLHVRKQRALEAEIDQSLSETCENLESPRDSPTENVRTEKDQTRFVFPANVNVISNDVEPRRPLARGPVIPRSTSGENTPVTENKLRSPHRVARSGSQDSVGSTHSDISHDRNRFHYAMKNAKNFNDRHGGSLDRKQGTALQKSNSDGSCERTSQGNSNRILQVMQEVAQHAGIDSNISKGHPSDNSASQAAVSRYGLPPVGGINHQEDDEQPIDYSMKYESVQNKGPPAQQGRNNLPPPPPLMPKYGNFVGPNNPQIYPVMHHSFPGQPMNQNMFGLRHHLPMMHQMVPVVPQFNAYAETDLDNDQPTDFSVRYAERDENYSDQPVSYSMQYQDSDPNCTDCKLEAAIRTSDQYVSGINEDQTMTFYTEGTPLYNLSTATSLTDLSNRVHEKDDSKEKEMKNQMQEEDEEYGDFCDIDKRSGSGSKLTELEKQKLSFHIPADDDHSEDQIKTYCEEGTPICFSRVSSLSSLHSSEAQDRQENKLKQTSLQSIEETERGKTPPRPALKNSPGIMSAPKYTPNTGRQKLLSDSDVQSDDISEKEHKTVTFDDNHQVEETPLMFSRCSSLSSLGSFDAFSVHSDVVSEYSRRAKGRQQSETVDDQSILNQSDDKENSSMSEVSEGEEDILAQCISSAMPISARKMRRSSSDNTIKKKAAVTKMDIQKNKPCVKQQNGQVPNKPNQLEG